MSRERGRRERRGRALGLALALLAPTGVRGAPPPPALSIRLSPETVRMGAFYSGARIRIEGTTPPGTDVVIVVRGGEEAQLFNRKARVGPLWVNVDRVLVSRVPSLFLRLGGDVHSLLDPASIEAYQLDDSAIKGRMICRSRCGARADAEATAGVLASAPCASGVEPDEGYAELIRTSYLALKAEEGTFAVHPGAVRLTPSADGPTRYAGELDWPRRARPGSYRIEAFASRERSVIGRSAAILRVEAVGFPAGVGALARTHPTAYGAAAVLAAVLAGLAMDVVVRRRRRSGVARRPKPPPPAAPLAPDPGERPRSEEREEPAEMAGARRSE
jgi:hypothetical protein